MQEHAMRERAMDARPREITLRFLAEPTDVNYGGKVHGGTVMRWIDQAGYAAAVGWAGTYCVTVAVEGLRFVAPIRIGDVVEVQARLVHTGTTSMHFAVDVEARDPGLGEADAIRPRLCAQCIAVFVALDRPEGAPTPVPPWSPRDEDDRRLAAHAQQVLQLGRAIEPRGRLRPA